MGLKGRLGRLGASAPLSRQERESRAAVSGGGVGARGPSPSLGGGSAEPASDSQGGDMLLSLREKMAKIMGDTALSGARVEAAVANPSDTALPFAEVEMHGGQLSQRLEEQRPSAHVGRMPLSAAAEVDPKMLSLLALSPDLAACDPRGALYFDTETTGLGGAGALAFLVGLAWFNDDGQLVLEQLLLKNPADEPALLARFEELVQRSSMLVSFNGKSFDWPLLQGRRMMNRLPELAKLPHLDLLHVSRRLHKRRLSTCRLINLEAEVLGWDRGEDDIPGAEIPARYCHFLRSGDELALREVVDHNAWDVLSMAALVGLYGEPLDQLVGDDLLSLTQTLTRAKAFDVAERAADLAVAEERSGDALEVRARLHKARGDKARALSDFEEASQQVDDPAVRLELAKLFEHHAKDFERALQVLAEGTGEDESAEDRRRTRLKRRAAKHTLAR